MADQTSAPLLNKYKLGLLRRRILQVITGGLNIRRAPCSAHVIQLCLWLSPLLIAIPFVIVDALGLWSPYYTALVYAVTIGLYSLLLEICVVIVRLLKGGVFTSVQSDDEQDGILFTSLCDRAAIDFIFSKKHIHSLIIHPFITGLLSFAGCFLLLPSVLLQSLHVAGVVFVFSIGWYAQCSALYSLCVSAPSELAVYRPTDTLELRFVTRPFYIITIAAIFIGVRSLVTEPVVYIQVIYSVLCLLPLGWALGVLPPLDALAVWAMEQLLSRLLGGSPMATDLRLLVQFLLSVVSMVIVSVLPDSALSALLATTFTFILSHNLFFTFNLLLCSLLSVCPLAGNKLNALCSSLGKFVSLTGIDCHKTESAKVYLLYWTASLLRDALLLSVGLVVVYFTHTAVGAAGRELATSVIGGLLLGALLVGVVSDRVQGVYVLGVVRNPLHPWYCDNVTRFKTRKRLLRYFAFPRALLSNFVLPLLLLSYIGLGLGSEVMLAPPGWAWIPISRILRLAWQDTHRAHRDLSVVSLLRFIVPQINTTLSFGPATQALVFGEALSILSEFHSKSWFAVTLFLTFLGNKKQRSHSAVTVLLTAGTFLLLPLVLGTILFSSVLSTPLLPLFTLPVFVLSFPRPRRFWPSLFNFGTQYTRCEDSVYYEQCRDDVALAVQRSMASGAVSSRPGTHLLVRFADRTILCTVLESGYGFRTLTLRGLELQETSCHTVEAARVDEIFEMVYGPSTLGCCKFAFNTHFLNSLQPRDSAVIQTYSDARNVLTGIIDQSSGLERFSSNLLKALVWVLLHHYRRYAEHSRASLSPQSVIGQNNRSPHMSPWKPAAGQAPHMLAWEPVPDHAPHTVLRDNDSWAESVSTIDEYPPHDPLRVVRLTSDNSLPMFLPGDRHVDSGESHQKTEDVFVSPSEVDLPSFPVSRSTAAPEGRGLGVSARVGVSPPETDVVPWRWSELLLTALQVNKLLAGYPTDWHGLIVNHSINSPHPTLSSERERELSALVMVCHSLVDVPSLGRLSGDKRETTPFDVYQGFQGEFPYSAHLSWLTGDQLLMSLVLRAYRYAVKLLYDEVSLGEMESHSELAEQLSEYDTQCFIGSETEREWEEGVLNRVPHLFSMARNKDDGVYTAHVLTLQDQLVHIGELNPESVRGVWSDLSLELLFLTNDDEERYSIQAHPTILRNLTIQTSDPPLGYSVYSSGLLTLP